MVLDRLRNVQVSAASKETTFGTAQTVDSLIRWNIGAVPADAPQIVTDQDLIGASEEPTDTILVAQAMAFPFAQTRVKPHTLAFIAAYALGSCSTTTPSGAVNARAHTIAPLSTTTLPSFTLEALMTSGEQLKWPGCFVDRFTLSVPRGANRFASLNGEIVGGAEKTAGSASASEVSEGGLNAAWSSIWLNATTYDGSSNYSLSLTTSDLTSNPSNDNDAAISFEWEYANNIDRDFQYVLGSEYYMGGVDRVARTQTVRYTRLYSDETYADALTAQTDYALQLRIKNAVIDAQPQFCYGMDLVFPQLRLSERRVQEQGGRLTETLTFSPLEDATYGSVQLIVVNRQTGYAA